MVLLILSTQSDRGGKFYFYLGQIHQNLLFITVAAIILKIIICKGLTLSLGSTLPYLVRATL